MGDSVTRKRELEKDDSKAADSSQLLNRRRKGSYSEEFVEQHNEMMRKKCICIVVLGDIGRSPRMKYHAQSFVDKDCYVHMIGHNISPLPSELINNPHVCVNSISEPPKMLKGKSLYFCPPNPPPAD